jgi:hypothetical protein
MNPDKGTYSPGLLKTTKCSPIVIKQIKFHFFDFEIKANKKMPNNAIKNGTALKK